MKYLPFIFLALLIGCDKKDTLSLPQDPQYHYGDSVSYDVTSFYSNVCSGIGKVREKFYDGWGKSIYKIDSTQNDIDKGCPKNHTMYFEQ